VPDSAPSARSSPSLPNREDPSDSATTLVLNASIVGNLNLNYGKFFLASEVVLLMKRLSKIVEWHGEPRDARYPAEGVLQASYSFGAEHRLPIPQIQEVTDSRDPTNHWTYSTLKYGLAIGYGEFPNRLTFVCLA
jgi:hypothetical protein